MACISAPTAILAGGALSAGSSLFGASNASSAATQAARIQAAAAQQGVDLQRAEFQQTQQNLSPFMEAGVSALNQLRGFTGTDPGSNASGAGALGPNAVLTSPISTASGIQTSFAPSPGQLAATPGYQFVLGQGKLAVGNQMAASGLAGSGPAGKGLVNYAEGLAGTTYQQQFANWQSQQQLKLQNFLSEANLTLAQRQQIFNMLGGLATTGQNAAAGLGGLGLQTATQASNLLTSGAAASAGGVVGSANALNAGLTNTGSAASNTALLLALNNAGMFGSPTATPQPGNSGSAIGA